MAFQPVKGANESIDRVMWKLFVWGKYLAVAALEANMCIARLTLGWIDPSSILSAAVCTWIPHTILAFNIWECVVLEARIAWRYGGSLYSSAAWLNVVNGSVLTITTMLQAAAHACSVSAGAFHFNHPLTYSLAYLTWNAKFASVAQDNAMLSHVGHSHFIAMLWSVLYGTDYMELRVGALLIHFSVGFVCAGPQDENLPDWIYKTGFGTFHQLFQGHGLMWACLRCAHSSQQFALWMSPKSWVCWIMSEPQQHPRWCGSCACLHWQFTSRKH